MKLGIAYNLFDGEELLEASIHSVRKSAAHIVVVYQTVSNFGVPARPGLTRLLENLQKERWIDELVEYDRTGELSPQEKLSLVSRHARSDELGGSAVDVAPQFFHELSKRELGRKRCAAAGCSHYLLMDADEFYLPHQLAEVLPQIVERKLDATVCLMRLMFRSPDLEYFPYDEVNTVPFVHRISETPLRLAAPYPTLADPTRRLDRFVTFAAFDRDEITMFHMSFVRKNLLGKLRNVSNRANLTQAEEFVRRLPQWKLNDPPIHPHPYLSRFYKEIRPMPNYFSVNLDSLCQYCYRISHLTRCSSCSGVFCSDECHKSKSKCLK